MGSEWGDNDLPRLETRVGISAVPMGHKLQRGPDPLRSRPRIAHLSYRNRRLPRMDLNF